jgi:DNA-binding PadR family transcriptional regulator
VSVTRLLVLGAVRIFQPAHGYLVRRELKSWHADEWANLNPGSVYNALRTLTRDGLLEEQIADVAIGGTGPAARATYRLTPDGEQEFMMLLREALWQLHPYQPAWLEAAVSFWWALSRREVLEALAARRVQIQAQLPMLDHNADLIRKAPFKPDAVVEHFRLSRALYGGELTWIDEVTERVEAGSYYFDGEVPAGYEAPAESRD